MDSASFLPVSREDLTKRKWDAPDILFITGDAYVDHPSFGTALLARLLEDNGFRVGIIAQPRWDSTEDFLAMGKPRLCAMITSGNIDSMVAHYTANNKPRSEDDYSPGGKAGHRPDRAVIAYCNRARQAYGKDVPLIIGGLEASLRRLAHYDYWSDTVRRSILLDSKADLLVYGMGELQTVEIAQRLQQGEPITSLHDIRGTAFPLSVKQRHELETPWPIITLPSYEEVAARDKQSNTPTTKGKQAYAQHTALTMLHENPMKPERLLEEYEGRLVVQNPPARPLTTEEFDHLYELPFTRMWHPKYDTQCGIPALQEVRFSLTSNRGCYGGCSFCAITSHQGRIIQTRSLTSLVKETQTLTQLSGFKGYIHDVGGPTANFQSMACEIQETQGPCAQKQCLFPRPCKNLKDSHRRYLEILKAIEQVPGVKKVFIRSGIRFDYLMEVADEQTRKAFISRLVSHHVSGQLKVAPEHVSSEVLDAMGKPSNSSYDAFVSLYEHENKKQNTKQYLIPYFIAAHPGSTIDDAITLALACEKQHFVPDQVQEFYPTPGTIATSMYYTGLDPRPGYGFRPVHVPKGKERRMQRALLHYHKAENKALVKEALALAGKSHLHLGRRS